MKFADTYIKEDIVDFAVHKLLCKSSYEELVQQAKSEEERNQPDLAVLDTRLLLSFDIHEPNAEMMQQALVRSHMRILYSVPSDRQSSYSGYSSEPILAEAAAHVMNTRVFGQSHALKTLGNHTASGLILKGERGELVARLILILAIDEAHRTCFGLPPPDGTRAVYYSRAVPVGTFLRALLAEDQWQRVRVARPDNMPGETLEDVFKNAKVRFTHFARAGDARDADSLFAYAAMIRGMAIQCCHQQAAIDIVIPIFMDNPSSDRKVCEEETTAILISVKNRRNASSRTKVVIDEASIGFFPPGSAASKPRPYITIVMELGIQNEPTSAAKARSTSSGSANTGGARKASVSRMEVGPPVARRSTRSTAATTTAHPRYSIYIYGCSPSVYGVINDVDKDKYAGLLTLHRPLDNSPRPELLSAIKALKPTFDDGDALSSWLSVNEQGNPGGEGVEVGQIVDPAED